MRRLAWYLVVVLTTIGGVVLGLSLLLARALRIHALDPRPDHEPDLRDLLVAEMGDGRIVLRPGSRRVRIDPAVPGIWGIESDTGYDRVGPVIEVRPDGSAVREFIPVQRVIRPGDRVRLDSFAHPADPAEAHGIEFEEVLIPAPLGSYPAWQLGAPLATWAIFVHGKGAGRREALRVLPAVHGSGVPCLVITYRNDPEAGLDPSGRYHYGAREWEDLEAAVSYAIQHGANGVVIFGYSMGGGISMSFMRRSPLAEHVRGLVLDAPMLHFERTVAYGAGNSGVPVKFLAISNRVSGRLFNLRWSELDYLAETGHLRAPILLFHGDEDTIVPVETSDALAGAIPELITYVRVPGAGHVRAWNTDQSGYEQAIRDFLARIVR
ncbi:MAG: alpha/beta hydrolase [Dehalococcoidia bacterium]|nr:alpha/beta hydrolase [Dehalococcoidia bacterium]